MKTRSGSSGTASKEFQDNGWVGKERYRTINVTHDHSHFQIWACMQRPSMETGASGCLHRMNQGGWKETYFLLHSFCTFWISYHLFKHGPGNSTLKNILKLLFTKAHLGHIHRKNIVGKQLQDTCLSDITSCCALLPSYSDYTHALRLLTELTCYLGLLSSEGEGNGNPLQYSCLENPMDGGAW